MSDYKQKLGNKNFQFWLKSILATAITKEGLDDIVQVEIEKVHKEITEKVLKNQICKECSIEEIVFCKTKHVCNISNNYCQFHKDKKYKGCQLCCKFRDAIRKRHKNKKPSWKNTYSKNWYSDPFEVAKCYLPMEGYGKTTTIADVDLSGVLSIIVNQKDVLKHFDAEKCKKARDATSKLRHSSSLEIVEDEMNEKLEILEQLLDCVKVPKALEAQEKIKKLRNDQLSISTDYVAKVLEDVISGNAKKSSNRILEATKKVVTELHIMKAESISKILEVAKGITTSVIYERVQKHIDTVLEQNIGYDEVKKSFKEDLLLLNKDHHDTIAVSPLFDKTDIALQEVYVVPNTQIGEFPLRTSGESSQENVNLLSLKQVFERNGKKCREIYVTSKAGLGKTVFCKRLALLWCVVHDSETFEHDSKLSPEEINILKDFDFLFLISLRDVSPKDCEIDAMIKHQIIDYMSRSRKYTKGFLEELLHKESCLIIIDGLDEWTHPETCDPICSKRNDRQPHRKSRGKCTFITTSRPWKFREIKLRTCHIDQHLEITGLSKEASDELIKKAIKKLNPEQLDEAKIMEEVEEFNSTLNNKNIQELKSDPLVVMYLTCLWCCDRTNFGHSRCDIYSSLVDLLLERAEKRNSHFRVLCNKGENIELPRCFKGHKHCQKYSKFLLSLGKLAFRKFFTKTREHSLVFGLRTVELEDILTPVEAMFAKEAGFLIASKYGPREAKYSFFHKTIQEFFVALYLQYAREFCTLLEIMDNVERVISNRKVLVFLSGLNPEVASNLSEELCKKVSSFKEVEGYRCDMGSWNYFVGYNKTMKLYQDMNVACNREYEDTIQFGTEPQSLCLYQDDIFIDEDFRKKEYSSSLKSIIGIKGPNIRSVKIRDVRTQDEFQERVKILKDQHISHLEKLDLKCQIYENDLCYLLETSKGTLRCFVIKGGEWQNDKWTHSRVPFSDRFFQSVQNLSNLSELYLRTMKLTHDQLNGIVHFLSNRESMTQIGLNFITCIDHECCPGVALNLKRHANLKMLELGDIPLENVDVNTGSLEVCYVGKFRNRDVTLKVFDLLRSAPNLHVLVCGFIEAHEDINNMLDILVKLKPVQNIWLIGIDLGKHSVPDRVNMENVQTLVMINVKMNIDTFKSIVSLASNMDHIVRVGLFDSVVEEKQDFENLKKDPEFLQKCEVLLDECVGNEQFEFLFKTVKDRPTSELRTSVRTSKRES